VKSYQVIVRRKLRSGHHEDTELQLRARCMGNVPNDAARKLGFRSWNRLCVLTGDEQPMVILLVRELPRKTRP
jgi:hypothetical protein